MFHEPPPAFLYAGHHIKTEHTHPDGTVKCGAATGFILAKDSVNPWIVTNRHVVDIDFRQRTPKFKDFELSRISITGRRPDDSSYTFDIHPSAPVYFHSNPENDVILIKPSMWFGSGTQIEEGFYWHFDVDDLADSKMFSESIHPFDLVCYSGFPDQHDKLGSRPIVRSGHIASDPKYEYSWDADPHGSCVAYEGFSSPGASGSPVFAPQRGVPNTNSFRSGYLVGVNAGHVPTYPQGHSGISYFYKSSVILDILVENQLLVTSQPE